LVQSAVAGNCLVIDTNYTGFDTGSLQTGRPGGTIIFVQGRDVGAKHQAEFLLQQEKQHVTCFELCLVKEVLRSRICVIK
jgi:hypothetical protein